MGKRWFYGKRKKKKRLEGKEKTKKPRTFNARVIGLDIKKYEEKKIIFCCNLKPLFQVSHGYF